MNPRHRRAIIPGLLVCLLAVVVVVAVANQARAADDEIAVPERVSAITDARVPESSGLVVSQADPRLAYTINDSGNDPAVFTVRLSTGDVVARTNLTGGDFVDTEALTIDPDGTLWVADIGDNDLVRSDVALYALDEPLRKGGTVEAKRFRVRYDDGNTDAEALLSDPVTGGLLIASKSMLGGQLYRLPADLDADRVNVADPIEGAEVPAMVTGGDFLPDGSAIVLRTYLGIHVLDAGTWTDEWSATLPEVQQGESLAVEPDGTSVLIGAEGLPSLIRRVVLPEDQRAGMLAPVGGVFDLDD
ncbi:hypothetical protein CLV56_1175 [Mumia flava]|uniref:Sugar lactone lactonase YvrE n=1 Tax=Mumia flava TaxID=1348852 RepID=A0A2M9BG77_9ACTN|nr:hypothetical protein [Mumia flava]PJJ56957.1 hypothetical protein CLV56_1175 [Mumia flava]